MARFTVQSEVAGTVWKIEVSVGDAVQADQSLVILESMKMEIPAGAPWPARFCRCWWPKAKRCPKVRTWW
jgi:acetyl/propionyl-CoA carboxylase alpha subunit